ncbi:MAG: ABC transporter ATP-binding protein [Rhodospirillaceae bacterium]|jgi:spermidine/putrescine transport system ATP-binding protein|nr:ABC transporter ATP-binding protein [Rhodospirillaceae bacterium]MBT5245132.1 ABC transporter ATP-binding protein [Rhodospirillaceae bacterium]MBT5562003.1 ABC transporter ATP-binding protein [Rhodospirillaceae bacterium]MBT6242176.1 ABC transporter ATP-binding protein [Rhodospirillaceae bacterium]MBT7136645.1 ABC transporter ATP-binding protein [Rhodospirillaceae bacterium]
MTDKAETFLELKGITKKFGEFTAVSNVNLQITEGEFFTLVGPSGSGKTTMIRLLVGMDLPTSGDINLKGARLNDVPANKRPTCMVFQSLALFPHRSVGENIEFPLKIAKVAPAQRRERAHALLEQLHLPLDFYDKGINQCSGGERQRVALARALAFDPELLFFDEPLSALDFRLRKALEKELKDIHRETGKTFVYITHSLEEAMVMSDRIGIMKDGELVQIGTPHEIYNKPINKFVAQFMGEVNTLEVEATGPTTVRDIHGEGDFEVNSMPDQFSRGYLIVRPEVMKLGPGASGLPNILKGKFFNDYALGSRMQYQIRSDSGDQWLVERLQDEVFEGTFGDTVSLGWRPEDSILVSD